MRNNDDGTESNFSQGAANDLPGKDDEIPDSPCGFLKWQIKIRDQYDMADEILLQLIKGFEAKHRVEEER